MQDFDRREALKLQPRIEGAQTAQHRGVVFELQRWMQAADNVQFGDPEAQRLARLFDDLVQGQLETVRIALFSSKGAKLAAQDAVIGIIDVAIEDITGAVAYLGLSRKVGNRADRVKIFAFEQAQCVALGNALPRGDFVV